MDPRVRKIVRSLSKRHSLSVLGWNREGVSSEIISDYAVDLKLFPLGAPFGKPHLIFFLPLFWIWVFLKLVVYQPKIIHACDLDTALPSYVYKTLFRKKLIFDIFDRYAMTFIPKNFKPLYSII
ncbi:MAG: hypothetical protein ACRD9Q_11145, partial [Nitrososphaeraceae archaeon]